MSFARLFMSLIGLVVLGVFGYRLLFTPGKSARSSPVTVVVTATPVPATVAAFVPDLRATATPIRDLVVMEVTREVPVMVAGPTVVIREIVEGPHVTVVVTATPTPTPNLSPGTVRVCVWMEGVKAVYIEGLGVVPGGCREFVAGVGASYIQVQVNR